MRPLCDPPAARRVTAPSLSYLGGADGTPNRCRLAFINVSVARDLGMLSTAWPPPRCPFPEVRTTALSGYTSSGKFKPQLQHEEESGFQRVIELGLDLMQEK
ncbi:hypothetical protein PQX77_001425 [Marasmius sp. AFHP31]|nr:hypothetical protein PQX77_001425 [Marasmius sp. AFHP31]